MEQLSNRAVTTLDGAINSSVTSLTVTSASTFPATAPFTIKVESELMRVTAVASNVFTVTRGSESTTAASHADDVAITHVVSKSVVTNLYKEMYQVGGYSSRPSSARAGTVYHATDVDYKWRYTGSAWDLIYPVSVLDANKLNTSGWTTMNFGSTVWTEINGVLVSTLVDTSQPRGKYHTIPTAPFTATIAIGHAYGTSSVARNSHGIGLWDGTKAKLAGCGSLSTSAKSAVVLGWATTGSAITNVASKGIGQAAFSWFKFEDDNTNWNYYYSVDGSNWFKYYSEARNTFLTPTHIGIFHERDTYFNSNPLYVTTYGYWEA